METSRLVARKKAPKIAKEVPVKELIEKGMVYDQRLTPWQMEHCSCVRALDEACPYFEATVGVRQS